MGDLCLKYRKGTARFHWRQCKAGWGGTEPQSRGQDLSSDWNATIYMV